jgi:hypothetical protein
MSNQRRHDRRDVRTLVTVLTDDTYGRPTPRVFKAWTEDLSASGMQIACNEELPNGRIYVRILLPELESKIVECLIVRRSRRNGQGMFGGVGPRFIYGVRFQAVQPIGQFQAMLDEARYDVPVPATE